MGKRSDLINDSKRDDFDECRKGSSLHLRSRSVVVVVVVVVGGGGVCGMCTLAD